MEVIFRLQGAEFVWDEHKARSNADKHGITFEEAAEAFFITSARQATRAERKLYEEA
jgi:uncharacterized DUF497 family protein